MFSRNDSGQSLLEITVAIGVAVVIVTALTIITITGLRNTQFAQNQIQATKLAQEWLEEVRSIRDRNGVVTLGANNNLWNNSGSTNCGTPDCNFVVGWVNASGSCITTVGNTPCLLSTNVVQKVTGTIFTRRLIIRDCNASPPNDGSNCSGNQRKVSASVSWADATGSHQSQLTTILTYSP